MRKEGNEKLAFLLVTDIATSPPANYFDTRGLVVPAGCNLPTEEDKKNWGDVFDKVEDDILRRVGVLSRQSEEVVKYKIKELLAKHLNVPSLYHHECIRDLQERFRAAILKTKAPMLSREDIRDIARHNRGLPTKPTIFIEPNNWQVIRDQLKTKHAIFLVGDSGIGKTTMANMLVYEHRTDPNPYINETPQSPNDLQAYDYQATERKIIHVIDPFGPRGREAERSRWQTEIERLLGIVGTELKLIVTSSTPFASRAPNDSQLGALRFLCDTDMYHAEKLFNEYRFQYASRLSKTTLACVDAEKDNICKNLRRPHSHHVLWGRLERTPLETGDPKKELDKIIEAAVGDSIERDLHSEFERASDRALRGLAVVWLVLELWRQDNLQERHLRTMQNALLDAEIEAEVLYVRESLIHYGWMIRDERGLEWYSACGDSVLSLLKRNQALVTRTFDKIIRSYQLIDIADDVRRVVALVERADFVWTDLRTTFDVLQSGLSE